MVTYQLFCMIVLHYQKMYANDARVLSKKIQFNVN